MPTKSPLSIFIFLSCMTLAQAQTPFACDGSGYLVISPDNLTQVYRVNTDLANGTVTYDLLSETEGLELNAIGFRKTDNLIYGINRLDNGLHRIDATGNIEFITYPPFPTDGSYIAGDVSPDGRFLVLLTTVNAVPVLRYVDLSDGLYSVTDRELLTLNGDPLFCTDIAFDPNTELVYGYDATSDRLAIINPQSGIADNTFFSQNGVVANTPSLFFDSFGNLFGLGAGDLTSTAVNLYKFDTGTGEAELFAPAEDLNGNSDGCSCPFNLALNQSFAPSTTFPCTQTQLIIRIANLTSSNLSNASLSQTLSPTFSVEEFIYNPFGGSIESALGTNQIELSGIDIPIGLDSIVVLVDVGEAALGLYREQASLSIVDPALAIDTTIVSDNPLTPIPNDSSTLEIVPLLVDFSNNQVEFCVGDELVIRSAVGLGLEYEWNDGSTTPELLVDTPGVYWVAVDTGCEIATDTINVSHAIIEVDLGEDMLISLGDEVFLNPSTFASGEIVDYIWYKGLNPPEVIDCPNCTTYSEIPNSSTSYTLLIRDESGCEAQDTKNVEVGDDYPLFAPSVFSPNRDGLNDIFYLQTKQALAIEDFRVFDRWGGLLFEVKDRMTNFSSDGWNGMVGGRLAPEGLYIWTANVKWVDGAVVPYSGEILLLY